MSARRKMAKAISRGFSAITALVMALSGFAIGMPQAVRAAACQTPTTDYGSVVSNVTIPTTAIYRIWSRIMVPDATNNSYQLKVDGTQCFVVGGSGIPANTWTWVDYQDGSAASKIQQSLDQKNHTFQMTGLKPGVKIDRLIMASDLNCVPAGNGSNCDTPADTTLPVVTLMAPAESATVSGVVVTKVTATDNIGVTKVELYANSQLVGTDTTSPYEFPWDTTVIPNASYALTAKAYDGAGNFASDTNTVTVQNGDSQKPSQPGTPKAVAASYNRVSLTWGASTDNNVVKGYTLTRNGSWLADVSAVTSYQDTSVTPGTAYSYQVTAVDTAGNQSDPSAVANVTTPLLPVADTQAPTTPADITATAVSSSQINLSWKASTDNIGVVAYDVYRNGTTTPIAAVTTTSFGDSNLTASTAYSYTVKARDAAGNASANSVAASTTTQAIQTKATILKGTVTDAATQRPVNRARVIISGLNGEGSKARYKTGSNGKYRFSRVSAGRYNLTTFARKYQTGSFTVLLQEGQTKMQDVSLQKR